MKTHLQLLLKAYMKKLSKAGPPPLPKDAFTQPPKGAQTPWDDQGVVSSAPKPDLNSIKGKLSAVTPKWQGKDIAHPSHGAALDRDAAINEFGHKMPRQQAEAHAYDKYVQGQHAEAGAHHLTGMKAAQAAGDMAAAQKHNTMYQMHSKALGHSGVGAPHPAIAAAAAKTPGTQKFKPHAGDMFAVNPQSSVVSSTPAPVKV